MNYYKLLFTFFRGQDKENELRTRFSVDNAFNCKYVAFLALYVHAMIKFYEWKGFSCNYNLCCRLTIFLSD